MPIHIPEPLVAPVSSSCATCFKQGPLAVTQRFAGGALTWKESFACACGHGFEAAGEGLPSPAARKALIAAHGLHHVFIDRSSGPQTLAIVRALTEGRGISPAKWLAKLPARVWEGTSLETEFVAEALRRAGASVRVVRAKR